MKFVIHPKYENRTGSIKKCVSNFKTDGELFGAAARNSIKTFQLAETMINIKSFKIPSLINGIIYRFIRKSKARRSYEFALILQSKGIGTPQPIAYFENSAFILKDSYYISEHLNADLTFRELTKDLNFPDHENILRQFMAFTYKLHENGVEFLDNTPGNTLIRNLGQGRYEFFLVDLNRMKFHDSMTFEHRIITMSKLTRELPLLTVMSDEYAKLSGKSKIEVFNSLTKHTNAFQERLAKKKKLKKQLAFWRSKN